MTAPLRVVSLGLGPIGLAAAKLLLQKTSLQLVGAIDSHPDKLGLDLSDLLGLAAPVGITVEADTDAALLRLKPDAVLHCTSSFLPAIKDQLLACARHGANVISSAEELLAPHHQHPELAAGASLAELDIEKTRLQSETARIVRFVATAPVKVEPSDKPLFICACGLTRNFPFCDGSHKAARSESEG